MDQSEIDDLWSRVPDEAREGLESRLRPKKEPEEVETLSGWLAARGLSQFESGLVDLGLEGVDDLEIVEREDLEILGLSPAEIAIFYGESPPEPATPAEDITTLKGWLAARGLAQFEAQLVELGVDGLEDVELLERDDLQVVGLSPEQIAVFMGEAEPDPKDVKVSTVKATSRTRVRKEKVAASGKRVVRKGDRSRRARTAGFGPQQVSCDTSEAPTGESAALDDNAINLLFSGS